MISLSKTNEILYNFNRTRVSSNGAIKLFNNEFLSFINQSNAKVFEYS